MGRRKRPARARCGGALGAVKEIYTSSKPGFGLAPAHARSQRGDMCHMVAAMPFIKPKLSIQGQKPDVGMAKCPGERSRLKSAQ